MSLVYLGCLLFVLACQALIDRRWRLTFWHDPGRATLTVAIGVAFFLLWDLAGVGLGVFYRGTGELMTGILLGPELPLEEVFFLTFLCYLTLNLVNGTRRLLAGDAQRRAAPNASGEPQTGADAR